MAITPTLVAAALVLAGVCPLTQAFITEDDKDELLKAHNFYRGKVSPIATNMAKLVSPPITVAAAISLLFSTINSSQTPLLCMIIS